MATKRKTTKSPQKRSNSAPKPVSKSELDRRWSILMFGIGVLLIILTLIEGESVWAWIRQNMLFGALGAATWMVGPLLTYWAGRIALEKPIFASVIKGVVSLVVLSSAALVFSGEDLQGLTFAEVLSTAHASGYENVLGSGLLGLLLGGTLMALTGVVVSRILTILIIVIVIMVVTAVTPGDIFRFLRSLGEKWSQRFEEVEEDFEDEVEETSKAYAQRRKTQQVSQEAPWQEENRPNVQKRRVVDIPLQGEKVNANMDTAPKSNKNIDMPLGDAPSLFDSEMFRDKRVDIPLEPFPIKSTQNTTRQAEIGAGGTFGTPDAKKEAPTQAVKQANTEPEYGLGDDFMPIVTFGPGSIVESAPLPTQKDVLLFGNDDPYVHLGGAESKLPAGNLLDVEYVAEKEPPKVKNLFESESPQQELSGREMESERQQPVSNLDAAQVTDAVKTVIETGYTSEENTAVINEDAQTNPNIQEDSQQQDGLDKLLDKAAEVKSDVATYGQDMRGTGAEIIPYAYPPSKLFDSPPQENIVGARDEMKNTADLLVSTLQSFGVETRILDVSRGPSVTRYEIQPQAGVKISRITNLSDDIALNLAAAGVRIEAPIPGKPAVGIEVPNRVKSSVPIRSLLESNTFVGSSSPLSIALGKNIAGEVVVADLTKMPHLLIAGSTGSGKSVCVNSIIMSFLYTSSPEEVRLILIDPKVVELAEYNGIPHLLIPVVTEPKQAAKALGYAVSEMEKRYRTFAEYGVRDINSFNKMAKRSTEVEPIPHIAIVIDELADLMMVASKDVENFICRIAQKARAAGMHLIVATQRPSVDVITGLIKSNIPSRIAFAVSSQIDSRTILDGAGAEKLLGMGDMLFMPIGANKPVRVQGTFVKDKEITRVLNYIKDHATAAYDDDVLAEMDKVALTGSAKDADGDGTLNAAELVKDETFVAAVELAMDAGEISTSGLQRRLRLGYARAGRLVDQMEQLGIVSEPNGSKPRQVQISRETWQEMVMNYTK